MHSNLDISGRTKLYCIIGMPAHHSLSPAIHNAWFKALGVDAVFLAFDVPKEGLRSAIEGMRTFSISGMTLTSPHKEEALKYVDKVDPFALKLGAVNTIINKSGELYGYNTDSLGFVKALSMFRGSESDTYTVIGAGGAGRAFVFGLLEFRKAKRINIVNRTLAHAKQLKSAAKRYFKNSEINAFELGSGSADSAISESKFIINATNITLENSSASPVNIDILKKGMIVFDANYIPLKNKFLSDAAKHGCRTINGIELLVNQGIIAFRLFTDKNISYDVMRSAALKSLK